MKTNILRKHFGTRHRRPKSGQTLVEYALILAFISVVAIAVLKAMGSQVKGTFSTIDSQLGAANTAGASASAPPIGG